MGKFVFDQFDSIGQQIDHPHRAVLVKLVPSGGVVVGYAPPGVTNQQVIDAFRSGALVNRRARRKRLT